MKKLILIFGLLGIAVALEAQEKTLYTLQKELEAHPKEDTVRVNKLNALAVNSRFLISFRRAYAQEALDLSQKLNYVEGAGYAHMYLGHVSLREGDTLSSRAHFHKADSIADAIKKPALKAEVLARMNYLETDTAKRLEILQRARQFAKECRDTQLELPILNTMVDLVPPSAQDSIYQIMYAISIEYGTPTDRVHALLTRAGFAHTPAQREEYFVLADSVAKVAEDPNLNAYVLMYRGFYSSFSDTEKQLEYLMESERIYREGGLLDRQSEAQRSIGDFYQASWSDYVMAMDYHLKSLETAEAAEDSLMMMYAWSSVGSLYSMIGDNEKALVYLQMADRTNRTIGDIHFESTLQITLGEVFRLSEKYPEAIDAYNKALKIYRDLGYAQNFIMLAESNLAEVYMRIDSLDLAFQYGLRSHRAANSSNDVSVGSWINGILSRTYLKKGRVDSAIYHATQGLEAAKQAKTTEHMRDNALALAEAYARKGDFRAAYDNRLLYEQFSDSMINAEVHNRTAMQQFNFNLDKKQAEIDTLNLQKENQRNVLIGSLTVLGIIVVATLLLWRNNHQRRRANRLLKRQKQEIDEKARNVELLSEIGRKITATLSVEKIIATVYDNVNGLMDASIFGIGIYHEDSGHIEFPGTMEAGKPLPPYAVDVEHKNRFAALCFVSGKEIVIGNLQKEYKEQLREIGLPQQGERPASVIYLPLKIKGEGMGVITVQSFSENAYTEYHLFMLRNIATYTAIAIENAESYETLDKTISTLKSTQEQLIQSEKMASLGELTAGIAHEIKNPLNFVNNFSEVSAELITEMNEELAKGDYEEALALAADIKLNLEKINTHGKRADAIVKGMLQHSRADTGTREPTQLNALADEYLHLAYHGLRAKDKSFNAKFELDLDDSLGKVEVVPQDIGRVLLNLFNNAFYAVNDKKHNAGDAEDGSEYQPTVVVKTRNTGDFAEISVSDNGTGIPQKLMDKLFQPFFTTKPTGEGTGLGLSISYDIVRAHGGKLHVETEENRGTTFIIRLPMA